MSRALLVVVLVLTLVGAIGVGFGAIYSFLDEHYLYASFAGLILFFCIKNLHLTVMLLLRGRSRKTPSYSKSAKPEK